MSSEKLLKVPENIISLKALMKNTFDTNYKMYFLR